jgi:hypothetical protein
MSFYQAIVTPDGALGKIGRELPMVFWDKRTLKELQADLKKDGAIEVERVATERRLESRGAMLLRDPHVMAIQSRLDLDWRHPEGPPPFQMRDYSKRLKPPIEPQQESGE